MEDDKKIREYTVENICDFLDYLKQLDDKRPQFARVWFRGHGDSNWKLVPSVHRDHTEEEENQLTNAFRLQSPSRHANCPATDDYGSWLALMQHYGLPTRLLDWTASSLAALFFAVENRERTVDGAVWVLFAGALNAKSLGKSVIPFLTSPEVRGIVLEAFRRDSREAKTVAVMTPDIDLRMAMQQGAFTIHGDDTPLEERAEARDTLTKFRIPGSAKPTIRNELRLLGIRRANLFPDLANLALDLKSDPRIVSQRQVFDDATIAAPTPPQATHSPPTDDQSK